MGGRQETLKESETDLELLYVNTCSAVPEGYQVVVQGSAEVPAFSELFYTQVGVNDKLGLKAMIDSGSMACTLNEDAEGLLREPVLLWENHSQQKKLCWLAVEASRHTQNVCMI